MRVLLVDADRRLGGVCLNRGCIPSKALLHATALMREAQGSGEIRGITFGTPQVHVEKLRAWKESILEKLAGGIRTLAQQRRVEVLSGRARFEASRSLQVETPEGRKQVRYQTAIIAVGSTPAMPKTFDVGDTRVMTSTEALELAEIPKTLLVVGGGYIGMELGTVYATLGSRVVLVEALDCILAGVDADLVRPVMRYAEGAFAAIRLNTTVVHMEASGRHITVRCEANGARVDEPYDRVLVSVGRVPNCEDLALERTKVTRDARGFIKVNAHQQTDDPAIFAIGDVVGGPLLAHKASREGRVAVETITSSSGTTEGMVIPAVVFTDPEVAWCGLTEAEAKAQGVSVHVSRFPWSASGRAVSLDRPDGMTKLIIEPETERILGVGIVGVGAGELISEGVLAVELGATAKNLAEAVHPHPTLSETLKECAESFYGVATHMISRRRTEPRLKV
jgi:dihydrolipoamide dehydrogenase